MPRSLLLLALSALALLGCDPENKPTMNPGQDCMLCHCTGSDTCTASSVPWTAAGTIFKDYAAPESGGVQGVHVMITDALGAQVRLTTNAAGNFYTAEPLQPPLQVSVDYLGQSTQMITQPTADMIYGQGVTGHGIGCNGCHQAPDPATGVPPDPVGGGAGIPPLGRVVIPDTTTSP